MFFPELYRMGPLLDQLNFSIHAPISYPILSVAVLVYLIWAIVNNDKTHSNLSKWCIHFEMCWTFQGLNNVFVCALTSSKVLRNRPSIASSVMMTVPPSTPIPPHVPIRMKIGSLHLAWYINLIISCNNIPTEGTPMPWLTHNTGPTCSLYDWCHHDYLVHFFSEIVNISNYVGIEITLYIEYR